MTFRDRILDAQEQHGYYISYSKGRKGQALYTYTIGLTDFDLPEFFISGLGRTQSAKLIPELVLFIIEVQMIVPGVPYDQFFKDMKCAFGFVHKVFYPYYFGKAMRYYGHTDFEVLQCIWPNAVFHPHLIKIFKQDILITKMQKTDS